jgi:hypothetical protein
MRRQVDRSEETVGQDKAGSWTGVRRQEGTSEKTEGQKK